MKDEVKAKLAHSSGSRWRDHKKLPFLLAHTHSHLDHRAGDPQFASLPSVQIVPTDLEGMRSFFGFTNWPSGIAHVDLGGRIVDVIPTPGPFDARGIL